MQPENVTRQGAALRRAYAEAWDRVMALQAEIADEPLRFRQQRRLREVQASIEREMDLLDSRVNAEVEQAVRNAYGIGGVQSSLASGGGRFAWTGIHIDAVNLMAHTLTDELLQATRYVRETTKVLIREVAKQQGLAKLVEGRTALQAAADARRVIEAHGIHAVRYANASRHGLAEYANMQMRTTTAIAYNQGTLNSAGERGTNWFEVFDGTDCGWDGHEDPQKANGMIVSKDDARGMLISHPNCRRSFGGRPDIETKADKEKAEKETLARAEKLRNDAEARAARGPVQAAAPSAEQFVPVSRHQAILDRHARMASR